MKTTFGGMLGGGAGGGISAWRSESIESIAEYSPSLALCRARRIALVPLLLNCVGTFTSGQPTTTQPAPWQLSGEPGRPAQFGIIDGVLFEVDCPSAFPGSQFKSLSDFFFGLQSGITASLIMRGSPQYSVAPDLSTPIRTLCAMINESWPQGWVIGPDQAPIMQFSAGIALNNLPLTVTVSFRMWTPAPVCDGYFINMTDREALKELDKMGFDLDPRSPNRRGKGPFDPDASPDNASCG